MSYLLELLGVFGIALGCLVWYQESTHTEKSNLPYRVFGWRKNKVK